MIKYTDTNTDTDNNADVKFDKFDNALTLLNKIKGGKISLTDVKSNQEDFKEDLGGIKKKKHHKKVKRTKKRFVQYWNVLKSKERGH